MIVLTAAVGISLVAGAAFVDHEWWNSVMIEFGATIFLVAPVLWMENALRTKLSEIDSALRSSATGLSAVRRLLPYGPRRTAIFDELLEGIRERAVRGEFDRAEIVSLLSGEAEDRTVALAVMTGAPTLIDGRAVVRSIRSSANANEQYYALRAARAAWLHPLNPRERRSILEAIDHDDRGHRWISGSRDRSAIAEALRDAGSTPEAAATTNE